MIPTVLLRAKHVLHNLDCSSVVYTENKSESYPNNSPQAFKQIYPEFPINHLNRGCTKLMLNRTTQMIVVIETLFLLWTNAGV